LGAEWPWSRDIWALAAEKLCQAGAKVVVLDLLFPNPTSHDGQLAKVVAAHPDQIVLGANFIFRKVAIGGQFQEAVQLTWPSESIAGPFEQSLGQVGIVNYFPDPDRTIRGASYLISLESANGTESALKEDSVFYHSLALQAASRYEGFGKNSRPEPHWFRQKLFRFAGPPGMGYGHRNFVEILVPAFWSANYQEGKFFKDKIVIIGPAGNWAQDYHTTPFKSTMLGPEIHCNALGALLNNEFLDSLPYGIEFLIIVGAGLSAFVINWYLYQPLARVLLLFGFGFLYAGLTLIQFDHFNLQVITATPLLTLATSGFGSMIYDFVQERMEKARVRSTLERYVSKNVVAEMLDHSEELEASLGGLRKPVTVLFSDVRGFTTMTEAATDSQAFVAQLNEYLSAMVPVVFRHNGTLDKFIGDAVMAVWGNVSSLGPADDAKRAAQSALEMLEELEKLNKRWAEEKGWKPFKIGIGLNHGEVICGNMGSLERMEVTVIGDAVNLASRLEGTTKEYGITLMVGESVAPYLRDDYLLQTVDYIQVKGKTKPVDTFTILPFAKETLPPEAANALKDYENGMLAYRAGKFQEALELFRLAANIHPISILAKEFVQRCQTLIEHSPEEPWTGVFVMTKK
jgi:adenylate cyclase